MTVNTTAHPTFDVEDYRSVFRTHPAAVSIVTLGDAEHPVGFTATSVVSVSADPAVIAFSVMRSSSSWPALAEADSVVLHLLDHADLPLAERFATSGIDRFEGVDWHTLETGEPVLAVRGTWVRCRVLDHHEMGGSWLVQAEPTAAAIENDRVPLVYLGRRYHHLSAGSH